MPARRAGASPRKQWVATLTTLRNERDPISGAGVGPCVNDLRVGVSSLLARTKRPECPAVMRSEPLASPDLYELGPMPGYRMRQSDRGTNRGRGACRAVRVAPEDFARSYSVGVGVLPRTPVDPRDDVPAVAADVNGCWSAASPAPGDEKRRARACRVRNRGGGSATSDRCRQSNQKQTKSLSAHSRVLFDRPPQDQLCCRSTGGVRKAAIVPI